MNKTALINKYNKKDTLIIVSTYPKVENGIFKNVAGVSTYTYHLVPEMQQILAEDKRKIVILAEILDSNKEPNIYEDRNILIYRCWKRHSLWAFSSIADAIKELNQINKIFIHFEFNMYGDEIVTGLFPLFLFKQKVKNKDVTLLLHQVVDDLSTLSEHINLRERSLKLLTYNFLLRKYYYLIAKWSSKVIVHDQLLKTRLQKMVQKPIFVIPHGLGEYENTCELFDAREILRIPKRSFVVLCFGFLTWYKGSDWIVNKFVEFYKKNNDKTIRLIMAGGPSANLKNKLHYQKYYNAILKAAQEVPTITVTGFIPDNEVHFYYCASDVVVLPYRTQMSASGPFAVGLSFDRPFLLSNNLSGVLETTDIKEKMRDLDFNIDDLTFNLQGGALFEKIASIMENKKAREQLTKLSQQIKEERHWSKICKKFLYIIDA